MAEPIDYASPSPPKSRWIRLIVYVIVVFVCFCAGAALFLFGVRRSVTVTVGPAPAVVTVPPPAAVVLPADPMVLDVRQRGWVQLPGGKDTPQIYLGDITRGQTLVTVTDPMGPTLLSKSMKEGDTASFSYGTQTLYLKVAKFSLRLTSDDQATLEISASVPIAEKDRIESLIAHLEGLDGATFIRNGEPHTAKDAAAHLRRKRDYVGDKITTAEQFIDELASKSSQSGEPYSIKLKDGTTVPAGEYLRKKLPEIDKQLRGGK